MTRHKNETLIQKSIRHTAHVIRDDGIYSRPRHTADRIVHQLIEMGWTPPPEKLPAKERKI